MTLFRFKTFQGVTLLLFTDEDTEEEETPTAFNGLKNIIGSGDEKPALHNVESFHFAAVRLFLSMIRRAKARISTFAGSGSKLGTCDHV